MMTRFTLSCSLIALAMAQAPLAAQQRPQDYTLPPNPSPTPTPVVEGPADDSGPVPVGPRAIPTATPTPSPTPLAQPTTPPAAQPGGVPAANPSQPAASPSQRPSSTPTPRPSGTARPAVDPLTPPLVEPGSPGATIDQPTGFIPEPIVPPAATSEATLESAPGSPLPDWWGWAAGLLGALFAGGLGGWLIARRRTPRQPPQIEPPIIADRSAPQPEEIGAPDLHIALEVEQLMRSLMMLTVNYRVTISNRSNRALRDIAISADLITSSRALPMEQQLASATSQLPSSGALDRIGPHQSASVTGKLQLPVSEIEVFAQGQLPICMPLVRLRVEGSDFGPELRTFLVGPGSPNAGGRVHPLPLSGPPGGYDNIRTRALETTG
ncbi:hypothetical protein [Altererythrobacter sp. Z27]|uniref:hypothetical protein n=1 Tax=Altererythrobacter sp. Z27 TaxID=3461147 RepID=UPI004044894E